MTRRWITVLLLVSAVAFAAGCGSSDGGGKQAANPTEELDAFYKSWFEYTLMGHHERTWEFFGGRSTELSRPEFTSRPLPP